MARPTDWQSLGLSTDPVSGDAIAIRASAGALSRVAGRITEQADALRKLNEAEGWESESGKQFNESSGKLAEAIQKAQGRYDGTAKALDTYATEIEGVQKLADGYLGSADAAALDVREATYRDLPGEPGTPEYLLADLARKRDLAAALAIITTNKNNIARLTEAGGEWALMNQRAATAIRASSNDDLTDQWYEGIKQWIHDARGWLNVIKDILSVIGTILAVAVLVVLLAVPGANVLALVVLGVVIAGLSFAITAAQGVAGDATKEEVGLSLISFALACAGLKFGSVMKSASNGLTTSISHSAGYSARAAGFSYSTAYQGTKAAAMNVSGPTRVMDQLFGGGLGELVHVRNAGNSVRATELFVSGQKIGMLSSAVASGSTYFAGNDAWAATGGLVQDISQDYWQAKTRVEIGSL